MKNLSLFIFSAFFSFYIIGCSNHNQMKVTPTTQNLYPEAIPGALPSDNLERVKHRKNNNLVLEKITLPTITAYLPTTTNKTHSAVIICPGGGYGGLSMFTEGRDVAMRLAESGVAAFVLKYRMPLNEIMNNKSFGPLQDLQQAIKLVRSNSKKWQLDPNKVGVMGFSAGGHLAASAAVHFNNPIVPNETGYSIKPDFQILLYPVISFQDNITHKGSRRNLLGKEITKQQINFFSNEQQVTTKTPPAFIVHASDDKAVPVANSFNYHQALYQHDVASQLLILPSGGHGFGMTNPFDWFKSLTMWMQINNLIVN